MVSSDFSSDWRIFKLFAAVAAFSFQLIPLKSLAADKAPELHSGIRGTVTFDGKASKPIFLPMSSDPKCQAAGSKGMQFQPISLGAAGGLSDTFIYIKKGLGGKKFPVPEKEVVLDQRGCWYYPRVAGAMVGQKVSILNSDPTIHNVDAKPVFNAMMPPGVKKVEETFAKPVIMQRIKCDVHPWMATYVGIVENPFFVVSDKDGNFEIKGVPPGHYVLEAWHERLPSMTQEITVSAGGVATVNFKFSDKEGAGKS